jgi:hypothetical protein
MLIAMWNYNHYYTVTDIELLSQTTHLDGSVGSGIKNLNSHNLSKSSSSWFEKTSSSGTKRFCIVLIISIYKAFFIYIFLPFSNNCNVLDYCSSINPLLRVSFAPVHLNGPVDG